MTGLKIVKGITGKRRYILAKHAYLGWKIANIEGVMENAPKFTSQRIDNY